MRALAASCNARARRPFVIERKHRSTAAYCRKLRVLKRRLKNVEKKRVSQAACAYATYANAKRANKAAEQLRDPIGN